jgi:ribonucleotide monophosphatase NagD (HAD superfamily)
VFGNRGEMATLLVLTGVTTQAELDAETQPHRLPTFVLPKLGVFAEQGRLE